MPSELPFLERNFTTHDGLRLYFRDYGSRLSKRIPILCLAGLTRNSKDFHELALRLSVDRRVITLDSRGRGRSEYDPNPLNYSMIVEAGDALGLLSAEIARPAIIIGTSRGGLLSLVLNGVRPDLVAGLVLNDIGPEIQSQGVARILTYLGVQPKQGISLEEAVRSLKTTHKSAFPNLTEEQWQAWAQRSYAETGEGLALDYDPKIRDAILNTTTEGEDYWPRLRRMSNVPTLLLRGENSDILSERTVQKMRRSKPDIRIVTVKGRGHVPFLDEPEVISAIDELLVGLDTE